MKQTDSELNGTPFNSISDLEVWDKFVNTLPKKSCRYPIFSFSTDTDGVIQKKLAFISWIPTNATFMEKLKYSMYDDFKQYFSPIISYQANDIDELNYDDINSLFYW